MHEMKLQSLSIFVGTGQCNAYCAHCAGILHKKYAPKADGIVDEDLIYRTIKSCHGLGARKLSLTGSGEPTLSPISVTKVLQTVNRAKQEGIVYSPIRMYSNGIKIGNDKSFCREHLKLWNEQGLTTVYVTLYDVDQRINAAIYRTEEYPPVGQIVENLHDSGLLMRANLVLNKEIIGDCNKFIEVVKGLRDFGIDYVSAWQIRDLNDEIDLRLSPLEEELIKMGLWADKNQDQNFKVSLLTEKKREIHNLNGKLVLFPDGTLSSSWCNR